MSLWGQNGTIRPSMGIGKCLNDRMRGVEIRYTSYYLTKVMSNASGSSLLCRIIDLFQLIQSYHWYIRECHSYLNPSKDSINDRRQSRNARITQQRHQQSIHPERNQHPPRQRVHPLPQGRAKIEPPPPSSSSLALRRFASAWPPVAPTASSGVLYPSVYESIQ